MKQKLLLMTLFCSIAFGLSSCGNDNVAATGLTLNKMSMTLKKGMSETLTATVTPNDASNSNVNWKSSDNSIVSVSNGKCTALSAGSATIIATSEDGNFAASCQVTVNVDISGITLSDGDITIEKGHSRTLKVNISPDDATNKSLKWKSSDENVATIDASGNITAVNNGNAIITATSADGTVSASCKVSVIVTVTGITLNKQELSITEGKKEVLVASIIPKESTSTDVVWSSSNESVATVSGTGEITAVKLGKATITAKTVDQNKIATCAVTVTSAENVNYSPYGDNKNW
ncbi:MAG: Ig-like domain-containing protein [Prevotella sp.]